MEKNSALNVLNKVESNNGDEQYIFQCPGCEDMHLIKTKGPSPSWGWNNDLIKPTFTPSILVCCGHYAEGKAEENCDLCKKAKETNTKSYCYLCHSFVTDGMMSFLSDCSHDNKNKVLPIQPWTGWDKG